jgi:hypothetical protein
VSLGLFVDCLNAFSVPGHSGLIQIQYPGPDMQVLLKYVIANFFCFFFNLYISDSKSDSEHLKSILVCLGVFLLELILAVKLIIT